MLERPSGGCSHPFVGEGVGRSGFASIKEGKEVCVEDVNGAICVSLFNYAGYVDLTGTWYLKQEKLAMPTKGDVVPEPKYRGEEGSYPAKSSRC